MSNPTFGYLASITPSANSKTILHTADPGKLVEGKLTITHKESTRFWITLDQCIQFVFYCLKIMKGGEIFIPKIPAIRITDLAKVIDPHNKCEIIGLRPSEKLHEVLISPDESIDVVEFRNYL